MSLKISVTCDEVQMPDKYTMSDCFSPNCVSTKWLIIKYLLSYTGVVGHCSMLFWCDDMKWWPLANMKFFYILGPVLFKPHLKFFFHGQRRVVSQRSFIMHYFTSLWHWAKRTNNICGHFQIEHKEKWTNNTITPVKDWWLRGNDGESWKL